jgi:hypothetical protein
VKIEARTGSAELLVIDSQAHLSVFLPARAATASKTSKADWDGALPAPSHQAPSWIRLCTERRTAEMIGAARAVAEFVKARPKVNIRDKYYYRA